MGGGRDTAGSTGGATRNSCLGLEGCRAPPRRYTPKRAAASTACAHTNLRPRRTFYPQQTEADRTRTRMGRSANQYSGDEREHRETEEHGDERREKQRGDGGPRQRIIGYAVNPDPSRE